MKRILSFVLLLLIFALTFTACDLFKTEETEPEVEYNVQAAVDLLVKSQYKAWLSDNTVKGDMTLVGQVNYRAQFYKVTWAAENEAVTLTANEDGSVKLAVVRGTADVDFALKATVTAPNGESLTHTFELKIPAHRDGMSHEEYMAVEKDGDVEIVGLVTFINDKNAMFLADLDGKGGYYVYGYASGTNPVTEYGITAGMTVKVSGTKDIYYGTHEVKNAIVSVVDNTVKEIPTFDLTDAFIAAADAKDASLTNYLGTIVTIKGVEIGGVYDAQHYYYFKLDGVESYIRLALSCGLPEADLENMKAEHIAHEGWTANITGRVDMYDGKFYLVPVSTDAIEYLSGCAHTGGTATCLAKAVCDNCGEEYGTLADHVGGTATCTTKAVCTVCEKEYGNILAHNWTETTPCTNGCGQLKPAVPSFVTFDFSTASTKNGSELTATSALELFNAASGSNVLTAMDVVKVYDGNGTGGAYPSSSGFIKMGTGSLNGKLVMNFGENKVTKVEIKCHDWNKKNDSYPTNDNTVSVNGSTPVLAPYTTDGTAGVLTFELSTASSTVTIDSSKRVFIFEIVVHFDNGTVNPDQGGSDPVDPPVTKDPEVVTAPKAGVGYWLMIAQNESTVNKNLYFKGTTESESVTYRIAMSENTADAVLVYLESVDGVDGAYKLYFMNGEDKTYIELSEFKDDNNDPGYGKGTIKFVESTDLYYTFDTTLNTLVHTDSDNEDSYMISTYKNFTTGSANNTSYVTGSNAANLDVTQFPARLVVAE